MQLELELELQLQLQTDRLTEKSAAATPLTTALY